MAVIDNLVAYYSLDESSGNALDAHGSNPLTSVNGVGTRSGRVGTARDFQRLNTQYLNHATTSAFEFGDQDYALAFWAYPVGGVSGTGSWELVTKDTDSPGSSRDFTIDLTPGNTRYFINGGGTSLVQWGSEPASNAWTLIIVWHNSVANTLNIQLNNGTPVSVSTGGEVPQVSSAPFRVGAGAYSGFINPFDGGIDELAIWKGRIPTSTERTWVYNSGAGRSYADIVAEAGGVTGKVLRHPGMSGRMQDLTGGMRG